MSVPPSKIMAERLQQFDDLRSQFPKRPEPPPYHVRIEELHDAMAICNPAFKGKVSLSNLVEIVQALNAKLDERRNPTACQQLRPRPRDTGDGSVNTQGLKQ